MNSHFKITKPRASLHETSDGYLDVIAHLCPHHRVVTCGEHVQWIAQRRKNGGAERPWRSVEYFRNREALIRSCATLCGRIDPKAMAILLALPYHFGGGQ